MRYYLNLNAAPMPPSNIRIATNPRYTNAEDPVVGVLILVGVGVGTAGAKVGADVSVGTAVGVDEVTGSNTIFPIADKFVPVDVSETSIGSVPAVVEVAVNVALPVASSTADAVAKVRVESVEFEIVIVSPDSGFPNESLSVMIIEDCVFPSAGTSVAMKDEFVWSGGFPAYARDELRKIKLTKERKKASLLNFLGISNV
jgi:hypothetical protein